MYKLLTSGISMSNTLPDVKRKSRPRFCEGRGREKKIEAKKTNKLGRMQTKSLPHKTPRYVSAQQFSKVLQSTSKCAVKFAPG